MVWVGAERVVKAREARRKNKESIVVTGVGGVCWMYVCGVRNIG
jgi:hypothetical protein